MEAKIDSRRYSEPHMIQKGELYGSQDRKEKGRVQMLAKI